MTTADMFDWFQNEVTVVQTRDGEGDYPYLLHIHTGRARGMLVTWERELTYPLL